MRHQNRYLILFLAIPLLSGAEAPRPEVQNLETLKMKNDKEEKEIEVMIKDIERLDSLQKTKLTTNEKIYNYTIGRTDSSNSRFRDTSK